jgi:hypothetical protein
VEADLAVPQGHRHVGGDAEGVGGAAVAVDAGRQVDGQDLRRQRLLAGGGQAAQHLRQLALDGTHTAGAQERIDHHLRSREGLFQGGEAGILAR